MKQLSHCRVSKDTFRGNNCYKISNNNTTIIKYVYFIIFFSILGMFFSSIWLISNQHDTGVNIS